ncbi:hypothetical protein [Arthrobacter sp. DR-2P]|nr:hypothetical protein [Arthrobacter sp. DR-2P]
MPDVQSAVPPSPAFQDNLQPWRPLFRWAGIASVLFVFLLIAALVLDFLAPPPVHGGAENLEFIAANKARITLRSRSCGSSPTSFRCWPSPRSLWHWPPHREASR